MTRFAGTGPPGPDGRLPRSARRASTTLTVIMVGFAVAWPLLWSAVGGLFAAAPGDEAGPVWPFFVVAAAGPLVAAMVWLGRRRLRRFRPSERLELSVAPTVVRRGQPVRVELRVTGAPPERVEVGLVCTETFQEYAHAAGEVKPATREASAWEGFVTLDTQKDRHSLELRPPPDVPYSYEGEVLSLAWRVVAREPVAGPDPASSVPIWVST